MTTRRLATLALATALCAAAAAAATPAGAATKPRLSIVRVSADGSIRAEEPKATAGRARSLRIDGEPLARGFMRFKLTGLTGRLVQSASLWVRLTRPQPWKGLTAYATNRRAWSEKTLAWNRRPALAAPTGVALRAASLWRRIDVTPLVKANGTVELALGTEAARGLFLSSREAGRAKAPRLHLRTVADRQPKFPVRAAFYRATYPASWKQGTVYHPLAGRYDGAAAPEIVRQLGDLSYGGVQAAIAPWSGPSTPSDARAGTLLATTDFVRSPVRWALSPTSELHGDPSPARIAGLLTALDLAHGRDPAYLRVRGRPVVFVPTEAEDTCDAVDRWVAGNKNARFYIVLATTSDYQSCGTLPSDWYGVDPKVRAAQVGKSAFTVSPGAFAAGDGSALLPRDLVEWYDALRQMRAARTRWQLVDSYDDWGEGTAVEPATEWASRSGRGAYLDALHTSGALPAVPAVTVAAAGDQACGTLDYDIFGTTATTCNPESTAKVVESLKPTAVLAIGDNVHDQGSLADFQRFYDPTWGRFKNITFPAPGNHEYCDSRCTDPDAAIEAGYLTYWGNRTGGTPGRRWYSFDLGAWHFVSLDSECQYNGGCGPGSPEASWLQADLAAHPSPCTLAYWHRPRFTGGHEGEAPSTSTLWQILYENGVELVLNGHQHQYERYKPQAPDRRYEQSGGITEIVAGTGGRSHIVPVATRANLVVENHDTFGVLQLALGPVSYSFRFVPALGLGGTFTDSGTGRCH